MSDNPVVITDSAQTSKDLASVAAVVRALKKHVEALKADVADTYAAYGLVPSQNQFFQYVSDNVGNIALQQDAAFVCERILVIGVTLSTTQSPFDIEVRQEGPGRDITFSRAKSLSDNSVIESRRVPWDAFIPLSGFDSWTGLPNAYSTYPNVDYTYRLPVDWLIPRGDVIKATMPLVVVARGEENATIPKVVLQGYKVF